MTGSDFAAKYFWETIHTDLCRKVGIWDFAAGGEPVHMERCERCAARAAAEQADRDTDARGDRAAAGGE